MKALKITLAVCFGALISIAVLELLARAIPLTPQQRYKITAKIDPILARDPARLEALDIAMPRNIAHPYRLYANAPNFRTEDGRQHNELGFRANELTDHNATTQILAVGGSTTYGSGVAQPHQAWPHHLQSELRQVGRDVSVLNAGVNYYTSAEILSAYAQTLQWVPHEILILHTGGNDLLPISFPNFEQDYTHVRRQGGQTAGLIERWFLRRSRILQITWLAWQRGSGFGVLVGQPFAWENLGAAQALKRVETPSNYISLERNVRAILFLAKAHGREVIVMPYRSNPYDPVFDARILGSI